MKDLGIATANIALGAGIVTAIFLAPSTVFPLAVALVIINM